MGFDILKCMQCIKEDPTIKYIGAENPDNNTLITNFYLNARSRYERAIELYEMETGDSSLYIKDTAYDIFIMEFSV